MLLGATYQGHTHEAGRYSPVDTDSLLKKMIFTLKTTPSCNLTIDLGTLSRFQWFSKGNWKAQKHALLWVGEL